MEPKDYEVIDNGDSGKTLKWKCTPGEWNILVKDIEVSEDPDETFTLSDYLTESQVEEPDIQVSTVKVAKGTVVVGSKQLASGYSMELRQDILAMHGIDIEKELMEEIEKDETFGFSDYLETDEPEEPTLSSDIIDDTEEFMNRFVNATLYE